MSGRTAVCPTAPTLKTFIAVRRSPALLQDFQPIPSGIEQDLFLGSTAIVMPSGVRALFPVEEGNRITITTARDQDLQHDEYVFSPLNYQLKACDDSDILARWSPFIQPRAEPELLQDINSQRGLQYTHPEKRQTARTAAEQARKDLLRTLEIEPVEGGLCHAGESALRLLIDADRDYARDVLYELVLQCSLPSVGAAVMLLLGRLQVPDWRADLLREALQHPSVEVRDAAVQAAEHWGGDAVLAVLRQHEERSPWLREYVEQVVDDLTTP